jgi:hypothetical protein
MTPVSRLRLTQRTLRLVRASRLIVKNIAASAMKHARLDMISDLQLRITELQLLQHTHELVFGSNDHDQHGSPCSCQMVPVALSPEPRDGPHLDGCSDPKQGSSALADFDHRPLDIPVIIPDHRKRQTPMVVDDDIQPVLQKQTVVSADTSPVGVLPDHSTRLRPMVVEDDTNMVSAVHAKTAPRPGGCSDDDDNSNRPEARWVLG